jgi:hypothetical protein
MRRLRVDTLSMGTGPTRVSDDTSTTRPLPSLLPGSLELVSPVSIGTTRRLRLPLFVSAPSLCRSVRDTSAPRLFSPPTDRGGVGRGSGSCFTGVVPSGYCRGDRRLSQLPEKPYTALPCSHQTPGGLRRQTLATPPYGPRFSYNAGSTDIIHFGAQSHGFAVGCLRLKAPFRTPAKARFRLLVRLCRAGWFPQGFS